MNKILIADDDKNILEVLKYNLVNEDYIVLTAEDGVQALEITRREKPDLIILDIMMPGLSGFEVCRILRKEMSILILILTAKVEEVDKVVGLELGADDYMTKPFSVRELLARIRAMLRRLPQVEQHVFAGSSNDDVIPPVVKAGNIEIDTIGHRVFREGVVLQLSPKEYDLLLFLIHHYGQVFGREYLIEKIWGCDYDGTGRTIDVHIRSLRLKIEDKPEKPEHLLTIHGFGYKFEASNR